MKFAAIDIGSNASRLLVCNVFEKKNTVVFKKATLIRVPLRLGEDAFKKHTIGERKISKLVKTMQAFRKLIEVQEVISFRACATSAMREAANSKEIVERVKKEAGISIEVINGKKEAEIIYSNHIAERLDPKKSYLYIDVGGGSTEITLFSRNKILASQSFNIGTLRMLQKQITKSDLNYFKDWIKKITKDYRPLIAIGSGGNINKIFSLSRKKDGKPITLGTLREIYQYLNSFTYDERVEILGLNTDRADVIIPAAEIFLLVMKAAGIQKIFVPKIGVSDGVVHLLYEEYKKKSKPKAYKKNISRAR